MNPAFGQKNLIQTRESVGGLARETDSRQLSVTIVKAAQMGGASGPAVHILTDSFEMTSVYNLY